MKFLLIVSLLLTACFLGGGPYKSEPRITEATVVQIHHSP